jgi:hypothetical protein
LKKIIASFPKVEAGIVICYKDEKKIKYHVKYHKKQKERRCSIE